MLLENSPGQNTGVDSLSLLQAIFPTQESNQGLLHGRQILYQLSHIANCSSMGCVLSHSIVSDSLQPHGLYPASSAVHGILQARTPESVVISYSRGSPHPGMELMSPAL